MPQIINFFIKHRHFILFLILLGWSSFFFIQSHRFQKLKFISSVNWITGNIYTTFDTIGTYFSLRENNTLLIEENKKLRETLFSKNPNIQADTTVLKSYEIITAKVIKNSFSKTKNYLTVNKGSLHSIDQDMAVITPDGILGIVEKTSPHFTLVQSVLNTYSRINAKVKRTHHFGTLRWNTKDHHIIQLTDIPRLANIRKGDTIVTGGMSAIFPEGIPIGIIKDFRLDDSQNYFTINVTLFNDMTATSYVYIIKNIQKEEILNLQHTTEDE